MSGTTEAAEQHTTAEHGVFGHPARVVQRATQAELLQLARERHALDPSVFATDPPFFFTAEISNDRLDAYFTRMHESSLRNYAADAEAGVSVQDSHKTRELGFGRSVRGEYVAAGQDGIERVYADAYTLAGLQLGSLNTDHWIRAVRAGIASDVSIGFYGGAFRCSICGGDMLDWWGDCFHIPGETYNQVDAKGNVIGSDLAFAWVHDAHLAEFSSVYDGATPGAAIVKAQMEAERGRLRPETARLIEGRYRIHLPGSARAWAGVGTARQEDPVSTTQPPTESRAGAENAPSHDEVRAALLAAGQPQGVDILAGIRALADELARLRPLADEGRAYREDLVRAAIAEGVRAYGAGFAQETYTPILESAPLDAVKRMRDDWQAIADRQLKGGRLTQDTMDAPRPPEERAAVPDAAYQA